MPNRRVSRFCLALLAAALATSCRMPQRQPAVPPPAKNAPAVETAGLHNVLRVTDRIISGSMPETPADFAALRAMGVRTVISVDGATPDVRDAHAARLRYVHLPVGYHGIDAGRQCELAAAVQDLPGLVYVHCHHGKHRGPAAAASAAVLLGDMTPLEGVAFLQRAGTSENYPGLFACVAEAQPANAAELGAANRDFPEIAPLPGFVQAMAATQDAYDHLAAIRDAGWQVPADHPDLVPLAEAGRLEDLLRGVRDDPVVRDHPADFATLLQAAHERAATLETALGAGRTPTELTAALKHVGAACSDCHARYRDRRGARG